jgi:hypothetical protein
LGELAVQHVSRPRVSRSKKSDRAASDENQLPLFVDPAKELERAMKDVDVNSMTPLQAFEFLRAWKQKLD